MELKSKSEIFRHLTIKMYDLITSTLYSFFHIGSWNEISLSVFLICSYFCIKYNSIYL